MKCYLLWLCLHCRGRCSMWAPTFLSHCGPSQQRLGAWAAEWRREAPLFSLWMLSLIMNECNSGKRAPWTAEETSKSSRAPEGIRLWQTTSPRVGNGACGSLSASNKKGEGVILCASIMKLLAPSVCFLISIHRERSIRSDAAGNLSPRALLYIMSLHIHSRCILYTERWRRIVTGVSINNIPS